ncbi:alpha/beta fold hydrolase [Sphingobium boeckii]|uniref:Pimeloyl-ACP methyl ester carboxylesterase n=1 Tax=Sphingobium boeckii TaxID=1082345 RepID=A0A7W9AFW1_9SPHN|nr:alpha/beta hydrolase [Sphingobium boeckii]MBB5684869.1 pimeloyl-ACP methyl ester carboxylesterase [Sphingobium boeckii]
MNRRELVVGGAMAALLSGRAMAQTGELRAAVRQLPGFRNGVVDRPRHRTAYIETGPAAGPLMIFVHGHPELASTWRWQMAHFAAHGWRCVAPYMRGYGDSSVHPTAAAYTIREISTDMAELHDALGGRSAVWVGHDWGAPIVWAMASNHPERCRAIVNLSVPYLARGFALPHLVALVDRTLYPIDGYPVGQWDYWLYYRESFALAQRDFEADPAATIATLYRSGDPKAVAAPAFTATLRDKGGWFGPSHRAPQLQRDPRLLSQEDFDQYVDAFRRTGFRAANAWYLNDADNIAFAGEARDMGHLRLPVLFLHGEYDAVCETLKSRLADPMRQDCANLSEASIASGHFPMLEQRDAVNRAIETWMQAKAIAA